MSAALIWAGQPSFFTSAASFEIGRARSGEWGPDDVRLELGEIDLHHLVVVLLGIG